MKTVVLNFKSAKLPIKAKPEKINEFGFTKDREVYIERNNPICISYEQISNVIHVLCGCRPAPTYRKSCLNRINGVDNIAKTALYKIDNVITYTKKDGTAAYVTEFSEGKKSPWNSHASNAVHTVSSNNIVVNGFFTWSSLKKKYIYKKDIYLKLISFFEKIYRDSFKNIKSKYTFIDFLVELRNERYKKNELLDFLTDIKCTPIKEFLVGNDKASTGSLNNNTGGNLSALCLNTSVVPKISLNGKIAFFIDEEESFQENVLKELLEGTHFATFLDGGLVRVESVFSDDVDVEDYIADGYKKV